MTPRELADRIMVEVHNLSATDWAERRNRIESLIAKAINEASAGMQSTMKEMADRWVEQTRQQALEEAAVEIEKPENRMRGLADACQDEYAKMIRALKSKTGEGK